ncbi:M3 family metallopeptidase [Altererythrobacter fulvus]|uniref:M3 family metallopeptidase n=1 Tax=Caenibius fulvus TaxID=2126012 RepID=UPI003017AAB9
MRNKIAGTLLAATALAASPAEAKAAKQPSVVDFMGPLLATASDAAAIDGKCDLFVKEIERRIAELENETGPATVGTSLVRYDELIALIGGGSGEFTLYQEVMADQPRRDAGGNCQVRLSTLSSKLSLSRPIYDRLKAIDASKEDAATQFYLKQALASFERSGVALGNAERAEIQALQEKIAEVGNEFDANIAAGQKSLKVAPSELEGLPEDFIAAHKPGEDGLVTITTATPDYVPVMSYAKSDKLRQELSVIYNQRAFPENDAKLRELLHLRQQLAEKLGRRNFAELVLEDKMVNTPKKVEKLLEDMAEAALPAAKGDYAKNLAVLQELRPGATDIKFWETGWLSPIVQQRYYDYDPQEARKYFAYNDVRDGILRLTQDLFGVEIRPWKTQVWDKDVEPYEVYDQGKLIGRFYLDSHPRPGKYSHANMVPLRPGVPGKSVPLGALVMNMAKGDHSTGLMEHGDVETFLHEFGHLIHGIFGGTQRWFAQSGVATEWDFVEAPSQMLENWVYDYDTLKTFAKDKDGNPIPRDLVEKMNRARLFNAGFGDMRQLGYSNISLEFHQQPVPENMGEAARYYRGAFDLVPTPDYVEMQAAFGHLNGYSAIYYTYRWSKVIADDLFTRFSAEGLRNIATAKDYREKVLAMGGTKPASELVQDFLGREVSLDAYRAEMAKAAQ